jgi:hypothetical protein
MPLKDKLVELIEELLSLFDDGNKLIYRRLIVLRHLVKNKLLADDIYNAAYEFYCENSQRFETKDLDMFKGTEFHSDIELIWSELSATNKNLVWKWVDAIITDLS